MVRFLAEDARPVRDTVLLALVCVGGMLTQYYFAITAAAIALVVLYAAVRRKSWQPAVRLGIAIALAIVVFVALNPHCLQAVRNMSQRLPAGRTAAAFRQRVTTVAEVFAHRNLSTTSKGHAGAFGLLKTARGVLGLAVGALLLVGAIGVVFRRRLAKVPFEIGAVCFVGAWTCAVTIALYLGFVSPPWAMADRYMAATWALGAAAIVVAIAALPRRVAPYVATLWIALMFWGTVGPLSQAVAKPAPALGDLSNVRHIVIDANRRGYVTRYLLDLPSNAEIFVAPESDLVSNTSPWLSQMRAGDLYVHLAGASPKPSVPLSTLLGESFRLEPIGTSTVMRLAPKRP
jgi:hypothetical protein